MHHCHCYKTEKGLFFPEHVLKSMAGMETSQLYGFFQIAYSTLMDENPFGQPQGFAVASGRPFWDMCGGAVRAVDSSEIFRDDPLEDPVVAIKRKLTKARKDMVKVHIPVPDIILAFGSLVGTVHDYFNGIEQPSTKPDAAGVLLALISDNLTHVEEGDQGYLVDWITEEMASIKDGTDYDKFLRS